MKKRNEVHLQADIVRWFNNNYCLKHHKPRYFIFAVQNEMAMQVGGALKSVLPKAVHATIDKTIRIVLSKAVTFGLKKGVSDLIVLLPNNTLFIELKTDIGQQRVEQKEFQEIVTNLNYSYYIARNLEDFKKIINKYI